MKVFTYYNNVAELNDPELIPLWKASWARQGWEPVVLTQEDARRANPAMFERFHNSPLLLSSPGNPKGYTLAAMLRWVAMTVIEEPCVHTDWDVMSAFFTPKDVEGLSTFPPTYFAGCRCPCAIYADGRGWRLMAAILEMMPFAPEFKAEDLLKDSCDQYALSVSPVEWCRIDPRRPCRNYNADVDWQVSPMIHFPNATTPYPRSQKIREMGFGL